MNKRNTTILIVILIIWNIVLTVLLFNNNNFTQTITEENVYGISTDLTKVAQDSYSSVVEVKSTHGKQTGFIYKQQEDKTYIITTYHGIGNDNTVSITLANSKSIPASVIGFDYKKDVAVLSADIPYTLNVVKCGDNEYTKTGEFIICIGSNSNNSFNSVELGLISNCLMNVIDTISYQRNNYSVQKEMMALSLNVEEGYSGSPLFNMKKEVIGMVQMRDDEHSYALTINELKIIADAIINENKVEQIELGVVGKYIKNMEDYERNILNISFDVTNGYYVDSVIKGSVADTLKILPTDIIVSINNNVVNSQKDLLNILYSSSDQAVSITVIRGDNMIVLKGNSND